MTSLFFEIGFIVIITATLAWCSLMIKQPVIIGYMLGGVLFGPHVIGLIQDLELINAISKLGIILLLFLAGLVLHPQRLLLLFKQSVAVTVLSSIVFCLSISFLSLCFHYSLSQALFIGAALMFSSTILVVKLLPTDTLHHQRMGSFCIAILITQDILAILMMIVLNAVEIGSADKILLLPFKGIALVAFAFLFEKLILRKMMRKVDRYHEILYLLALAWCFSMVLLSNYLGFSPEFGAFIGGVALARNPISYFITEGLKFFGDFFLVLFFFVLGAEIDLQAVSRIIFLAIGISIILVYIKPIVFEFLLRFQKEERSFSRETAIRLGQSGEFSIILAWFALQKQIIDVDTYWLIDITTVLTMVLSSYRVVFRFYTPFSPRKELKVD